MAKQEDILKMVNKLDPKLARQLGEIVNGKVKTLIYCNSKTCKGKLIGRMYSDGSVVSEDSDNSGCLSTRKRFDGFLGVMCLCGNDSRLAPQEKGIIRDNIPSVDDLEKIYENLTKKPSSYKTVSNKTEVDGFTIEEIK